MLTALSSAAEKMIYCIADTHGDITRFKDKRLKKLKKGDCLIICGDFGFIWDGSKKEKRILKKLGKKKYYTLFVEGAHENFELLQEYPITEWNGGEVRVISQRLMYLCRGSVFNIGETSLFAFGGGLLSEDEQAESLDLFKDAALPSAEDIRRAINNLENANRQVDYIVSYEPPSVLEDFFHNADNDILIKSHLNTLFDEIVRCVEFKKWIFGKCHKNKTVSPKYTAVYTAPIALGDVEETRKGRKRKVAAI